MGDGAYQGPRITDAARQLAAKPVLHDFAALAKQERSALNAVLLGALSAAGGCPLEPAHLEAAIAARGVAADANLRGFRAGRALVTGETAAPAAAQENPPATSTPGALHDRADAFPVEARDVIHAGIDRLIDYQDTAYAELYLNRLEPISVGDSTDDRGITRETARYLALWMAYEDVIRVADLKTRASRFARVRAETGAGPGRSIKLASLFECLENALLILERNTRPGIRDGCNQSAVRPRDIEPDPANIGEFDGVAQQVDEYLTQTDRISEYGSRRLARNLYGKRQPLFCRERRHDRRNVIQQVV